jgi:hypothetical protein
MKNLVGTHSGDYQAILKGMSNNRYKVGFARLARLIGDNPVAIDRDPGNYSAYRRGHLLGHHGSDHIPELIEETKGMDPKVTKRDLKEILRFAGNASFVTEHDDVIEFRDKENRHLCKYLLKDKIMMVIDDLGFLEGSTASSGELPLAELVTIYPMEAAAERLAHNLTKGRYLPNCVHLPELMKLLEHEEKSIAAAQK